MSRHPPVNLILLIFCIRLLIGLSTNGFFQPDEYFQALEPAHRAVFGFGHLTWEWTANPPIRSFVYPSLFVPAYALVKAMHLENTRMLIWAPKLVQVAFATLGDAGLYRLARSLGTESHANVALFLSLVSPFNTLALTRTLANSTETSLTILALSYWPFSLHHPRARTRIALSLAALSCMIRPTAAILWIFLGVELVWRSASSRSQSAKLLFDVGVIGLSAVMTIAAVDTIYYGTPTFTPLSFLKTNLVSGIARFYGANAPHYYLTQGLPIILGPALPFAVLGVQKHIKNSKVAKKQQPSVQTLSLLLGLAVWTITVYSFLAHKEWRFIHPVLPILHIFAADYLVYSDTAVNDDNQTRASTPKPKLVALRLPIGRTSFILMILTSLPLNVYLLRWHGSAQIAATHFIHDLGQNRNGTGPISVGVLMPCHSTPWQAYFHLPHLDERQLWALGCEPPLGLSVKEREAYVSQTDVFFETLGPVQYFERYFPSLVDSSFPPSPSPFTIPGTPPPERGWNHTWPSHLVMFGALEAHKSPHSISVREKLKELGYKVIWRARNGWEDDERRRGGTVIWEWTGSVV